VTTLLFQGNATASVLFYQKVIRVGQLELGELPRCELEDARSGH